MTKAYEVGYKKPPKSSQFKKGQSGNPKGRPKKKQTTDVLLEKELSKKVRVNVDGKEALLTKHEILIRQLVDKAVKGADFKTSKFVIDVSSQNSKTEFDMTEHDEQALEAFLKNNK